MIPEDLLLRKVLFLKDCELLEKTPSLLGKVTKTTMGGKYAEQIHVVADRCHK